MLTKLGIHVWDLKKIPSWKSTEYYTSKMVCKQSNHTV